MHCIALMFKTCGKIIVVIIYSLSSISYSILKYKVYHILGSSKGNIIPDWLCHNYNSCSFHVCNIIMSKSCNYFYLLPYFKHLKWMKQHGWPMYHSACFWRPIRIRIRPTLFRCTLFWGIYWSVSLLTCMFLLTQNSDHQIPVTDHSSFYKPALLAPACSGFKRFFLLSVNHVCAYSSASSWWILTKLHQDDRCPCPNMSCDFDLRLTFDLDTGIKKRVFTSF